MDEVDRRALYLVEQEIDAVRKMFEEAYDRGFWTLNQLTAVTVFYGRLYSAIEKRLEADTPK